MKSEVNGERKVRLLVYYENVFFCLIRLNLSGFIDIITGSL
jgi:hypothetical protein